MDFNESMLLRVARVYALQDFWEPKSNSEKQRYLVLRDETELQSMKLPDSFQAVTLNQIENVLGDNAFELHMSRTAMAAVFYQAMAYISQMNKKFHDKHQEMQSLRYDLTQKIKHEQDNLRETAQNHAQLVNQMSQEKLELQKKNTELSQSVIELTALLSAHKLKKKKKLFDELMLENKRLKKRVDNLEVELQALS